MARFKDIITSPQGWIHDLARAEVHPDAEEMLQLGRTFDPQQLVEESSIEFLMELREHFNEYARIFNSLSEKGARFQEVKVYAIAQTAADFMIFRNQVKLVISNNAHGVIQLSFAQHSRDAVTVGGQASKEPPKTQELIAQVGPFRDIYWTYQGEKVDAEQVAKFYFSEFIRATRDSRRSRQGNQLLLDQIKALLQEKGLDL